MADRPSDDELLERELNQPTTVYRHGRSRELPWYRRHAGTNVMLIWAAVLWLMMIAATMAIVGKATDLGAIAVIIVMGIEGVTAIWLSRVLWRAIGPGPRQVIRFAARFWFLTIPLSFVVCGRIAAPFLVSAEHDRRIEAGATAEQAKAGVVGAVKGATWQILLNPDHTYLSLSHDAAAAACAALGPGHRLPTGPEIPLLAPMPLAPERLGFWMASEYSQARRFSLKPHETPKSSYALLMVSETAEPTMASVLCVNGDALDAVAARVEANLARSTSPPPPPPAPITVSATPLRDLAAQVKREVDCAREARRAALSPSRDVNSGNGIGILARNLQCLTDARQAQTVILATIGPTQALAPAGADVVDRIGALAARSWQPKGVAFDDPALAAALASDDLDEAQAAEVALARMARSSTKAATAAASVLLKDGPGARRAAHALGAAGVVSGCEWIARNIDSRAFRSANTDALRDFSGPCARAAAKVLQTAIEAINEGDTWQASILLELMGTLGSAGGSALHSVTTNGRKGGTWLAVVVTGSQWRNVLDAEHTRIVGVSPVVAHHDNALEGVPPLNLEVRPCLPADFGLPKTEPAPIDVTTCMAKMDASVLQPLRDTFVPLN